MLRPRACPALAVLAVVLSTGPAIAAPPPAPPWPAVALEDTPAQVGWDCGPSASSPDGHSRIAACRPVAPQPPGRIALLLIDTRAPMPPLVLARLGAVAERATLHAFEAPRACNGPATPCIAGVLLVEPHDGARCLGLEVYAWAGSRRPQSLGTVDVRPTGDCLGPSAALQPMATGALLRLRTGTHAIVPGAPRLQPGPRRP